MKKIHVFYFIAGILLSIYITSCGGSGSILSKSPSDVVKASVNDIMEQKYSDAVKYFVRKDGEKFTDQDIAKLNGLLLMVYQEAQEKKGVSEIQVIEEKIEPDGTSAYVKYKLIFKDGTEKGADSHLRKVDGNWLMIIG